MESKTSKAQLEVWEWKDKAYQKIKDLPQGEWLKHITSETKALTEEIKKHKKQLMEIDKPKMSF
jgi:hypothetical protein